MDTRAVSSHSPAKSTHLSTYQESLYELRTNCAYIYIYNHFTEAVYIYIYIYSRGTSGLTLLSVDEALRHVDWLVIWHTLWRIIVLTTTAVAVIDPQEIENGKICISRTGLITQR